MARITPIDVIQGISGKYGSGSSDYFATNSSSNRIRLAKYKNKPTGDPTTKQLAQRTKFGTQCQQASEWLNANKELRDADGNITRQASSAYKKALELKRLYKMSNIRQVVVKYMDESGNVSIPNSTANAPANSDDNPSPAPQTGKKSITLTVSPEGAGTVTGAGQYDAGSSAEISAVANSGYQFVRWDDGETSPNRTITVTEDKTFNAIFTTQASGDDLDQG